jgi:hypothetical protein
MFEHYCVSVPLSAQRKEEELPNYEEELDKAIMKHFAGTP